ncbi:MAG: hypothetical protein ABJA78_00120 [Ferruginibacter sp.]
MPHNEHIEKRIDDALNSADNIGRAAARPFLFTRLHARMNRQEESLWERVVRTTARPSVVISGLCMIICINAMVIAYNNVKTVKVNIPDQLATADEFSTSVTALYYNENSEP